ncbi:hypothetical protein SHK09_15410 [Polaribacter sp. PL03]|uniref:hypothetical protein n=1 Tax=Polaribacter sp. PL03 TaxID=3088353 RepID=UPI0029D1F6F7|nr:hypothetical protein [Polaribacter sp. PL03]MDX6748184.1 hypothetical protein [Polaribacter sp. PL03]
MKKILFIITIFFTISIYSQEIQFVKEYGKVNYRDNNGSEINKSAKSYLYFYEKGKVKIKIINTINLTLFFTKIEKKELIGIQTTFFEGIDSNDNNIRGFYTNKNFTLLGETSTLILDKE